LSKGRKQKNFQQQKLDAKNVVVKKLTLNKDKLDQQMRLQLYSLLVQTAHGNGTKIDKSLLN